ncbi:hypothetical protein HK405_012481, partial [Cladochytrium tenue]
MSLTASSSASVVISRPPGSMHSAAPGDSPPSPSALSSSSAARLSKLAKPALSLSQLGAFPPTTPFANFSRYVDPSGKLNFTGKVVLHAEGVDFSNGNSYRINMSELDVREELGKGQYGVVQKVLHTPTKVTMGESLIYLGGVSHSGPPPFMHSAAMKEIRLELDQTKLNQILMELDVLHKSQSSYIVEFYGAFFVESCVYYWSVSELVPFGPFPVDGASVLARVFAAIDSEYDSAASMEYMDAGSVDKLYAGGIGEDVLAKIALSMVHGLKFMKDELSIIHRDVKPTNVLVNTRGEVKLCDFGVSGQLIQSLAKTNVGCQSYMAPERISAENSGTYTVQSDIWSLGMSLVEMALGRYPYPAEEYHSVFDQINAIVLGDPPGLPEEDFSKDCRDFVAQ